MLDYMLYDHPAAEAPVLDNQFFRDGFPYEASFGYASMYHGVAKNIAEAMGPDGRWVWDHPHVRASFHSFADLVCLDRFTHFSADMGGIDQQRLDPARGGHRRSLAGVSKHRNWPGICSGPTDIAGSPAPSLDDLFKTRRWT